MTSGDGLVEDGLTMTPYRDTMNYDGLNIEPAVKGIEIGAGLMFYGVIGLMILFSLLGA
jgi:hypothetical protein